jgi:hypothetical protein
MIHIYKKGGNRTDTNGNKYEIEAINEGDYEARSKQGWHKTLEQALCSVGADANEDGEISLDEAKAYAKANDIDIDGIHHKTVIRMVKDHIKVKAD